MAEITIMLESERFWWPQDERDDWGKTVVISDDEKEMVDEAIRQCKWLQEYLSSFMGENARED